MRRLWWLVLLVGCKKEVPLPVPITTDQVPDVVMRVAHEKLPDVTFDKVWKTPEGNYEFKIKTKRGKTRDLEISPDGKIVEFE